MENGHHKRLRAIAEPLYREHPNDPEALWMMAFVKLSWGDHKTALDLAEKAAAADPKNPRYRFVLAEAVGLEARKASVLRQPGLARRFKKEMDTALSLDPKNIEAMNDLIGYYFEAPGIIGGDKAKGRAMVDQIMRINPADGYLAAVTVARYDKQDNRFEELLRKAVDGGPTHYLARVRLASFCVATKKYAEGETQARTALRIDPTRVGAHASLVAALTAQDKWPEVDGALAEAEKDVPDDLTPYLRAAVSCLARSVELPMAERYLRKYLTQEPEPFAPKWAQAHWRLGQVLEKEGRKREAVAEWQAAVKLDPESPAKQDLKK
jgi:tetratricopeptide (TPR) repeat protein